MPRSHLDRQEQSEQPTPGLPGSEVMDMRRTVVVVPVAVATLLAAAWPASGQPGQARAGQVAQGDFNGDEFFDVAVGAPGERVGSVGFAGAVNVLYGSEDGLGGGPLFVQSNPESVDGFGESLATAGFNGDGFFDLAVGAAGENVGAVADAGSVTVLFGSPGGITTAGSQTLFQGGGAAGAAESGDNFGLSVATGLLAGDDLADLVVGVPGEDVGAVQGAGAVNLLSGSARGVAAGPPAPPGN